MTISPVDSASATDTLVPRVDGPVFALPSWFAPDHRCPPLHLGSIIYTSQQYRFQEGYCNEKVRGFAKSADFTGTNAIVTNRISELLFTTVWFRQNAGGLARTAVFAKAPPPGFAGGGENAAVTTLNETTRTP